MEVVDFCVSDSKKGHGVLAHMHGGQFANPRVSSRHPCDRSREFTSSMATEERRPYSAKYSQVPHTLPKTL